MNAAQPIDGAARRPPFDPATAWALALLTGCNLAFAWAFPHFISQDGPAHLYNSWILLHYRDPGFDLFRASLEVDYFPIPNLASHLLLIPLLAFFPPVVAEKILVSLYLILWPAALSYAVRSVRRGAEWIALLAMPLAMNWFLHMGFYNFCFGVEFLFFAIGAWLRRRREGKPGAAVLFALLTALYFCHLLAFMAWCIAVASIEGCRLLRRAKDRRAEPRGMAADLLPALVPLAMAILFAMRAVPGDGAHSLPFQFDPARIADLFGPLSSAIAFRHSESEAAALLKIGLVLLAGSALLKPRFRRSRSAAGFGWLALAFLAIYLTVSNDFGGGNFIAQRFQFFIVPAALLWLAGHRWGRTARLATQWGGAGIAVLLLVCRIPAYAKLSQQYDEWLGLFGAVPARSTVLPVVLTRYPMIPPDDALSVVSFPLLNLASLAAAERGFLNLGDYEAHTRNFPLRWRAGKSPVVMGNIGEPYPKLDLAAYGGAIDWIALWDNGGMESKANVRKGLLDQMERNFRPAGRSAPNGFGELFRRVSPAAPDDSSISIK